MNISRIVTGLRFVLGATFIFSAVSKLLGVGLFEIAIVEQGIFATREAAAYPARFLIALELFIGIALFLPFYLKQAILPSAILLLTAFSVLQIYQLTFGESASDCGCFGELVPMSSAESLAKNVVLLGLSVLVFIKSEKESRGLVPLSGLGIACCLGVLLIAPARSIADETFVHFTQFQGIGRVDLTSGDKLVAIFNAECEHCQAAAIELRELIAKATNDDIPEIYILMFAEDSSAIGTFSDITNTKFPFHRIGEDTFLDLIGNSPPRLYWLHNGSIEAKWDEKIAEHISASFGIGIHSSKMETSL